MLLCASEFVFLTEILENKAALKFRSLFELACLSNACMCHLSKMDPWEGTALGVSTIEVGVWLIGKLVYNYVILCLLFSLINA